MTFNCETERHSLDGTIVSARFRQTAWRVQTWLESSATSIYRAAVTMSLVALATLLYVQQQENAQLVERIEKGNHQLQNFAGDLDRTKARALTPKDLKSLRKEIGSLLTSNKERLVLLERRSKANARVIAGSMSSVVFLQGSFGYRERKSGRMLRQIAGPGGRVMISPTGQPFLTLNGDGPVAERQFTGTGFAVGDRGALITNRHVAKPWENDPNYKSLLGRGFEPVMIKYLAYLPGSKTPETVKLLQVSQDDDLAVLQRNNNGKFVPGLRLAKAPPRPGEEVIVMGYPTGLRAMLAHSGKQFFDELRKTKSNSFWKVAARLAQDGRVAPLATRGIVSQTSATAVVYDAETTHGGSGGPVLDTNGSVVAVNAAILPEYGGSNIGVPVARVWALLKKAGLYKTIISQR